MTLREIAEAAHVSIGTVDRVLHNRGRVSPETKAKIEALIEQHGYKPNPIARHLKLNKKYTFAVLLPNTTDDSGYWKIAYAGIQKAAKELKAFGVGIHKIEFNRYDPLPFFENIHRQLEDGHFDGLLMAPVQPELSSLLLKTLSTEFPVVFFDAQLPDFPPLSRIGQNAFQSGVLAGRLLDAFSVGEGPYCVVSAHSEDFHIRKRIDGFLHYFESLGATAVPSAAPGAASPASAAVTASPEAAAATLTAPGKARQIRIFECRDIEHKATCEAFLQKLLAEIPSPGGIFVTNASVHGVASYVNNKGATHIAVVGYDLVPDNECQLRAGTIDCILSQRPEYQAYEGIYQLYSHVVLQQTIEKEIIVPIDIYVRENLP